MKVKLKKLWLQNILGGTAGSGSCLPEQPDCRIRQFTQTKQPQPLPTINTKSSSEVESCEFMKHNVHGNIVISVSHHVSSLDIS